MIKRFGIAATATGATLAVTLCTGVAYAAWTTTATGTAAAKADTLSVTAATAAPTPASGATLIHPGVVEDQSANGGDLYVSVTNNNTYPLYVDSVQQTGPVTPSGGSGTCGADTGTYPALTSTSGVFVGAGTAEPTTAAGFTVTLTSPVIVAPGANAALKIPHVVSMTTSSVTGCQGASFSIPVTLTVGTS